MIDFIIRYLMPKFIREQYYFADIKAIRDRYSPFTGDPKVNAERLKLQMDAADYWRVL